MPVACIWSKKLRSTGADKSTAVIRASLKQKSAARTTDPQRPKLDATAQKKPANLMLQVLTVRKIVSGMLESRLETHKAPKLGKNQLLSKTPPELAPQSKCRVGGASLTDPESKRVAWHLSN